MKIQVDSHLLLLYTVSKRFKITFCLFYKDYFLRYIVISMYCTIFWEIWGSLEWDPWTHWPNSSNLPFLEANFRASSCVSEEQYLCLSWRLILPSLLKPLFHVLSQAFFSLHLSLLLINVCSNLFYFKINKI